MTARKVPASRDLAHALYVAAIALGRTREAEEVVRTAIAETQRASGLEAVALHLLDARREALLLREYAGTTPAFRERMSVLPLADPFGPWRGSPSGTGWIAGCHLQPSATIVPRGRQATLGLTTRGWSGADSSTRPLR